MKNTFLLLCSMIGFLAIGCHSSQAGLRTYDAPSSPADFKPGKCYAKCMTPDRYEESTDEYILYTGDASADEVPVETLLVEVQPATTKWVQKRRPGGCQSADPKDCMMWCQVEVPAQYKSLKVLRDTSLSSDYRIERITSKRLLYAGGNMAFREVLCASQLTDRVVFQIQDALVEKGYMQGPTSPTMTTTARQAMNRFQQESGLPVGQFDLETMDHLGVIY
ncbi:MAG: peptidoglycan-binding domain-containing protein [Bacteroidota bacterium]